MKMTYVCKKVDLGNANFSDKIHMDLNAHPWNSLESSELCLTGTGGTPNQQTKLYLCYDNYNLHALFACDDDYINAKMTNFNDPIYNEEVVEIFIDENCDGRMYHEIEVSPINTVLYYLIHNRGNRQLKSFARLENTIISKVDVFEGGYNILVSVPLDEFFFKGNLSGKKWHFNAYRIDRPRNGNAEHSAVNPTGKIDFHMPEKFVELAFE